MMEIIDNPVGLDNFFHDNPSDNVADDRSPVEDDPSNHKGQEMEDLPERKEEHPPRISNYYNPQEFEVGQDIDNIFLLDVQYNSQLNLAQCVFYHPETESIYRWNDTTGHKPYLLTFMSEESIKQVPEVVGSSDFVGMESVTKYLPLDDQQTELMKVYGDNPLAIGGTSNSFRNYLKPYFEADIRYHFNYVADRKLTPGTFYRVNDGDLVQIGQQIDSEVEEELLRAFAGESPEQLEMLNEYMPLLFQEIPDITRCAFDIEVGSEVGKMPNTANPLEPIISIALADSRGRKICWVLNTPQVDQQVEFDETKVLRFDNELEMLRDFFNIVNKYPIAFSFNGDNFDSPYLINRAQKLGMQYHDIPFNSKRNRSDTAMDNSIHVDLHLFFRQASIRIYAFGAKYESASLDELATTLLNRGKLEHSDVWINEMDLETLVSYNVRDAELTLQLTQFDDNVVLNLIFILMRICKMPLFDFTRTAVSGWLQMWLIYEHRKRNFLIPQKQDILSAKGSQARSSAIIDGKKFQGAIVLDPKPGVWWDVHVLDFASLYPSIIKTKNLSYETILCGHEECKKNVVPEVGHYSCTKRLGLFAIVLGFVRDTRVNWFKPRSSDASLTDMEQRINQVIQSSLKVLINAGYGVFGSEAFDFYCPPVAESTTAYARSAIKQTKDYVEETLGVDVLYGDTDSVFLYQPSPEEIEQLMTWSSDNIGVELGTDYIFRYVVFSDRKKNYFGITKKGYPIVKGLMGKKSNTPPILRDNFNKILEIFTDVHEKGEFELAKQKIKDTLQSMIQRLENRTFEPEEIAIRMSLSKKLSEYQTWTQSVQAAAQLLADNYDREHDHRSRDYPPHEVGIGTYLEFVKVDDPVQVRIPPNTDLSFPVGDVYKASVVPLQLVDPSRHLDGKPVIEMAESTFAQILISIGLSWDEIMGIQSLDEFF